MSYKKQIFLTVTLLASLILILTIAMVSGRVNPDLPWSPKPKKSSANEFPLVGEVPRVVNTELGAIVVSTLLDDLDSPWALASLPNDRFLITTKSGKVLIYDALTNDLRKVRGMRRVIENHRAHLFDVYVHPEYQTNRWVYFSYAVEKEQGLGSEVARAKFDKNRLSEWQTLFTSSPGVNRNKHFGGGLAVDNGFLYIALGEHHKRARVQDLSTHIGKIVRLHDDGRIPADNPFIDVENALPEIYALGFRNPQNIAIDKSGNIWVVEHGPSAGDELNRIIPGANFGWPLVTLGTEYNGKPIAPPYIDGEEMIAPVYDFKKSVAPSGLAFYNHELLPFWKHNVLVTTLIGTHLSRLELEDNNVVHEERLFLEFNTRLRDVHVSSSGRIYLLTEDGRLVRVDAASE